LPDIVRAAAEPMGNIDHLTVLSNDGASDMVRNVTRTVTEAGATVKGLTGIDIPEMLSQAMGGAGSGSESGSGGTKTRPPSGPKSGGSGSTSSTTTGGAASASGGPTAAGATASGASSSTTTAAPSTGAPATLSTSTGTPPRFTTPESVDAAIADAERAVRAASAPPTPRTDTAAGPARPASAGITRETTLDDAATRLAADLRAVPGIERFAAVRLDELQRSGPRPLRTMWRIAREQLDERFGQLTIGELIERYGSGPGPSA
jgi:flotillin